MIKPQYPGTPFADTSRTRPPTLGGNKALIFACFMAGAAGSLMGHGFLAPEPEKVPVYPSFSLSARGYLYEPQTTNYRLNDSGLYVDGPVEVDDYIPVEWTTPNMYVDGPRTYSLDQSLVTNIKIWTREVEVDDYIPVEWTTPNSEEDYGNGKLRLEANRVQDGFYYGVNQLRCFE